MYYIPFSINLENEIEEERSRTERNSDLNNSLKSVRTSSRNRNQSISPKRIRKSSKRIIRVN